MAERRMFAKAVVNSDNFLDMPVSTQNLYFHLGIHGDDDGFINSPKRVMRTLGATDDDLKLLIAKGFLIPFDNGVVVVRHWKTHNYIRSDRYKPTQYAHEKAMISERNGVYDFMSPIGIPSDNHTGAKRLHSIGEVNKGNGEEYIPPESPKGEPVSKQKRFTPPSIEEVTAYCTERGNGIDPQSFVDYYTANGWMVGKTKMKDWRAAVRNWERNRKTRPMSDSSKDHNISDPAKYRNLTMDI